MVGLIGQVIGAARAPHPHWRNVDAVLLGRLAGSGLDIEDRFPVQASAALFLLETANAGKSAPHQDAVQRALVDGGYAACFSVG
jgi:hypothetical protein